MYRLSSSQSARQAVRLQNVDTRLVVGYAKTRTAFVAEHPNGPLPFVVEGHRTPQQQAGNYAQGRTTPGPIITNKKPGQSLHELNPSRALDIGFLNDLGQPVWEEHNYKRFFELWKLHNPFIVWGGLWTDPHDPPHFQVEPR